MGTSLSERLVTKLASMGRTKTSRRTFLATATITGTALAVNPWDYITKPQDAYASVCGPGASCNDGWSAMCCSINAGKNTCPPNTFAGGWWKADRSSFCGGAARYYIDCNALPGKHFTCRCNKSNCDQRYVACNVFRYGQCNTDVHGTTAVVCRQISCLPPWQLYPGKCGTSSATDNNTALHNAPCLTTANTYPRLVTFPVAPHALQPGHSLLAGQFLASDDRHTQAEMQSDGDLVIRNARGIVWRSLTAGTCAGGHAYMRANGQFVIVDPAGHIRWATPADKPGSYLRLTDLGQLTLIRGTTPVWNTNSHTP